MANEVFDDDAAEKDQPSPPPAGGRGSEEHAIEGEPPGFPEHVRRAILESEERILARWEKRGLFGLTTSTG
jgi:hypothetical protein